MSKSEIASKSYTYLLEDVMRGKFTSAIDPKDLWNLVENKKVRTKSIDKIKHWIYFPCWSHTIDNTDCFYSIYQVLNQRSKFPTEMKRIRASDTKYPIIVIEDEYDKQGSILDGNHRFAKLILEDATEIKYKYVKKEEIMKIMIKL